jgi:hypothetical protein
MRSRLFVAVVFALACSSAYFHLSAAAGLP